MLHKKRKKKLLAYIDSFVKLKINNSLTHVISKCEIVLNLLSSLNTHLKNHLNKMANITL